MGNVCIASSDAHTDAAGQVDASKDVEPKLQELKTELKANMEEEAEQLKAKMAAEVAEAERKAKEEEEAARKAQEEEEARLKAEEEAKKAEEEAEAARLAEEAAAKEKAEEEAKAAAKAKAKAKAAKAKAKAKAAAAPEKTIDERWWEAINKGDLKAIKELTKDHNLDINQKNRHGDTALLVGTKNDKVDMVKKLCAVKGIDMEIRDIMGDTAIHVAARMNDRLMASALVNIGHCDHKAKANDGNMAYQQTSDQLLKEWLLQANPTRTRPPWQ